MKVSFPGYRAPWVELRPATSQASSADVVNLGTTADDFVAPKLAQVLDRVGQPYYDEAADTRARDKFYQGIDFKGDLFEQMGALMRRTHRKTIAFKPLENLHPWIDLRPNMRLQSVYSAEPRAADAPIDYNRKSNFTLKERVEVQGRLRANGTRGPRRKVNRKRDYWDRREEMVQALVQAPTDAVKLAQTIATIEGKHFYNAEHTVPKHLFDRMRKAKGDLHILFTCERYANSYRGHLLYGKVEKTPENRVPEGWSDGTFFEPEAGKGEVARATLYFLMRYPGLLGDQPGEYGKDDVKLLVQWAKEDPAGLYELHRNHYIEKEQGNRNPLIDFPELLDLVDFTRGLGEWGQAN